MAGAAAAPVASTPAPTATPAGHRRRTHRRAHLVAVPVPYGVTCPPTALRLAQGPLLSQATSQDTLLFTLTNVSGGGCDLRGYPGINLLNAGGRVLPFHIHWGKGRSQMVTSAPPPLVPLAPGGTAYFVTSKWICVRHSYSAGRYIQVIPPNDYQLLQTVRLRARGVDYCRAGDPGNTVDVSPVEPSLLGVFRLRS